MSPIVVAGANTNNNLSRLLINTFLCPRPLTPESFHEFPLWLPDEHGVGNLLVRLHVLLVALVL